MKDFNFFRPVFDGGTSGLLTLVGGFDFRSAGTVRNLKFLPFVILVIR